MSPLIRCTGCGQLHSAGVGRQPLSLSALEADRLMARLGGVAIDPLKLKVVLRGSGGDPELRRAIKRSRRDWLNYLTVSQRQWQRTDRRVHEKRNLRVRTARQSFGVYAERGTAGEVARRCLVEAIESREQYVRCA